MMGFWLMLAILTAYGLVMVSIGLGWRKALKNYPLAEVAIKPRVTLIVAMRNEAHNLPTLFESIALQQYPASLLEVILSDDFSEDGSAALAKSLSLAPGFSFACRVVSADANDFPGKKAAIRRAVLLAQGELIVLTDADCSFGRDWIGTLAGAMALPGTALLLGPVRMTSQKGFGHLQALEFSSLLVAAAGSAEMGFPLMANGANLCFRRNDYAHFLLKDFGSAYASGDDMFLMLALRKSFGRRAVRFVVDARALVSTPAEEDFSGFVWQRLRWASKGKGYSTPYLQTVAAIVYLANAGLLVMALAACVYAPIRPGFGLLVAIKCLIDFPLLLSYNRFQGSSSRMLYFPLLELLNVPYTTLIGMLGLLLPYSWKGRRTK